MTDKTPEQQEIERLREHNSELLADLKKQKAANKELTAQVETLTGERDAAVAAERKVTVDNPVNEMAARVAVLPDHFRTEFEKLFQFVHQDGAIVIQDKEGNPAMVKPDKADGEPRPATFTEADIRKLCDQSDNTKTFDAMLKGLGASGGGAMPSNPDFRPAKPDEKKQPEPVRFGLT